MYGPVAPIMSLFAIPAVAMVAFLATPFARKRRLVPWLLAPVVYALTAAVALFISVNAGFMEP